MIEGEKKRGKKKKRKKQKQIVYFFHFVFPSLVPIVFSLSLSLLGASSYTQLWQHQRNLQTKTCFTKTCLTCSQIIGFASDVAGSSPISINNRKLRTNTNDRARWDGARATSRSLLKQKLKGAFPLSFFFCGCRQRERERERKKEREREIGSVSKVGSQCFDLEVRREN